MYKVCEIHTLPQEGYKMNVTISMPKQFIDKLKDDGKQTGMTYSEIIRRALDQYWKEVAK